MGKDVRTLEELNHGYVRAAQVSDVGWFDRNLAACFMASNPDGSLVDRAGFLDRIGRCNVVYFRGNLAEAERGWRSILADAEGTSHQRIVAEAEHGLGNLLNLRSQPHNGAPHLWRAYELYEDQISQMRVLTDLGIVLLRLGHVEAAERALNEVVRHEHVGECLTNALIELMNCASYRRDA
jgi:hypothetical protein